MRIFRFIIVVFAFFAISTICNAQQNSGDSIVYKDTLNVIQKDSFKISIVDNPSIGYTWKIVMNAGEKRYVFGKDEFEPPKNGMIGAAGVRHFYFKAKKKGQVTIKFVKQRGDQTPIDSAFYLININKK